MTMPGTLRWDELEFLECLEASPVISEYEVCYAYKVRRDGSELDVSVWPLENVVEFSFCQAGKMVFEFAFFMRGPIQLAKDENGEYLHFQDGVFAPSRFWYQQAGDLMDQTLFPTGIDLYLRIKPRIGFQFAAILSPAPNPSHQRT
ncbi:MAG: hypothetical protein EYC62_04850 [Alphaproteobacteria bacterium]|nr:MAG: hypothetical protein EYC62_04850 [Alphaproteobacteria bacterium]